MGIAQTNTILIINSYFRKKLGLAFGAFTTGIGVFGLTMPQVTDP